GRWLLSAVETVMGRGFVFCNVLGCYFVYFPGVVLMVGIRGFFIGFLPKFTSFVWFYITYSFFVLYLGGLFQFPDWLEKLTPFGYIPQVPVEDMEWMPVLILTVIAVVLIFVGFVGYRRRDIEG